MVVATPAAKLQSHGTARRNADRKFRPDVEGLRAIAVVMVLLDHAGLAALSGGYVGVDVFFVLSGFLITGLLLKEQEHNARLSVAHFYARRARRLLPAGSLVLVATVLAAYHYLGTSRANRVAEDARWSALFASNFRFIQQGTNYLDAQLPPSPLQHFWSLAVEEQFYAVWPALIILVAAFAKGVPLRLKLGVVLTAVIGASLLWSMHQTEVNGTAAYFSPLPRACELGAGALLAVVAPRLLRLPRRLGIALSWGGVAAILATGFLFDATTRFPGHAIALPVIGTILAVAGGTIAPESGAEVILSQFPFQWIGKLSYSLYLWHWPLLVIAAGRAEHDLPLAQNLLLCGIAVVLAAATFQLLEDPIRDSTILKRQTPLVSVALGVVLVAFSFGVADRMGASHAMTERTQAYVAGTMEFPTTEQVVRAVADGVNVTTWPEQPARIKNPAYSKECDVARRDTTSSLCVHGDPNATRTVVVYGDSHAAMWIPPLDVIGKQEHWRVIQLTKPACPVADFPVYSGALRREYTECAKYRAFALAQLEQIQPDIVLLSSAYKDVSLQINGKHTREGLDEAWEAGLASMLDRIKPHTGRIVLIGDMAYPAEPGIDCLTAHPDNVPACNTPREKAVYPEHNEMERRVATEHGAEYVDVIPWLCTDTVCPAVVGGLTTHRDAYHIAENYTVWLTLALGNATGLIPDGTGPPRD
jgi:peptidoglycan/LPS O-acetylase OafA/YrhL